MKKVLITALCGVFIAGCTATKTASKDDIFSKPYIEKLEQTIANPVKTPEHKVEEVVKIVEEEKKKAIEEEKKKESIFEKERKNLLVKLIKNPPTPIKTPEKIIRVLILPYVDEQKVLHTQHFSFIKVDDGSWILGDYLLKEGKMLKRHLTPLEDN